MQYGIDLGLANDWSIFTEIIPRPLSIDVMYEMDTHLDAMARYPLFVYCIWD